MRIGNFISWLFTSKDDNSPDPLFTALAFLFLFPLALATSGLVYLFSGSKGIIPWKVADYVILLSIGILLLSSAFGWFLIEGRKRRIIAVIVTIFIYIVWFLSYFLFGFMAGLPGTEWVQIESMSLIWALPLIGLALVLGMRTDALLPFIFCVILALPIVFAGANFYIAMQMRTAIAEIDLDKICVVQKQRFSDEKYKDVRISLPTDINLWPIYRLHHTRIVLFNGDERQTWIFTKHSFSQPHKYAGKKSTACLE